MLSKTHSQFENDIQQELLIKYGRFKKYQTLMLDVLADFHRVCEKHNIQYFLAYGSLLGAIRDKGQIPWDYDIDVWVRFEDKEKLFYALKQDLSKNYYFVCRYYDKKTHHRILRISPKGYSSEVLHVDVFWLSGASDNPNVNEADLKTLAKYRKISLYKHCNFRYIYNGQFYLFKLYIKFKIALCKMIPDALLDSMYDKRVSMSSRKSNMITDGDTLYAESKLFVESELITLANGMQFHIPKESKKLLTFLYGDYMNYLPIADRMEEFYRSLNRIETLGNI